MHYNNTEHSPNFNGGNTAQFPNAAKLHSATVLKLHECTHCCPAAAAVSQIAWVRTLLPCCSGSFSKYIQMLSALAVAGYQTACTWRLPCCSGWFLNKQREQCKQLKLAVRTILGCVVTGSHVAITLPPSYSVTAKKARLRLSLIKKHIS
jgi:hypothetical protein